MSNSLRSRTAEYAESRRRRDKALVAQQSLKSLHLTKNISAESRGKARSKIAGKFREFRKVAVEREKDAAETNRDAQQRLKKEVAAMSEKVAEKKLIENEEKVATKPKK